jgi:hypothetical protein
LGDNWALRFGEEIIKETKLFEISGSQGGEYEGGRFLGYRPV